MPRTRLVPRTRPATRIAALGALVLGAVCTACASQPPRSLASAHEDAAVPAAEAIPADDRPMSATVIGPLNPLLTRGAEALAAGHADEGIRLTLQGLKRPGPVRDTAAAHANLCAGYVLVSRLDDALTECNVAIALDPTNWRAYNNRAAVFTAQGLYERALEDIAAGMKLAPGSPVLQRSLAIIHHDQQVQRRRGVASDA